MRERLHIFRREKKDLAIENRWPEFERTLFHHDWTPANVQRVKEGYTFSQGAFLGQPRKSGKEWQFRHGEHVALRLVEEWEYRDPVVANAGLNHDTVEDTDAFELPVNEYQGETLWPTQSHRREFARKRLAKLFDKDTARIVMALTHWEVDHVEILTPEQALEKSLEELREANDMRVLATKLEDRIDNLEEPFDLDAHKRKVEETKELYLPIFNRLLTARYKVKIAERRLERLHELLRS